MTFLNKIFYKLQYYINSIHYLYSSIGRNVYPCKLIGQQLNFAQPNNKFIKFKLLGRNKIAVLDIKNFLACNNILNAFSPLDASKIGSLTFEEIVKKIPSDQRKNKILEINNLLLNSSLIEYKSSNTDINFPHLLQYFEQIKSLISKNFFPFKIVGGKLARQNTVIIYTTVARREGFEKQLTSLINDKRLLMKFNPYDAFKLGMIAAGDKLINSERGSIFHD